MTKPSAQAGGDGIGVSITVSTDQHDDDNDTNLKPPVKDKQRREDVIVASFIPLSVLSSPIPFCEEDEGDNNAHHTVLEEPHIISSIMRHQSRAKKVGGEEGPAAELIQQSDQAHVSALEDRVRDLEEKLSTLSMLLLPKRRSPRNNVKNKNHSPPSGSSSPDSSRRGSISPPTTPFRSLESFSTIPSSNVPALESPIASRYRNHSSDFNSDSDNFVCNCSLPYERRHRNNPTNHNSIRNNLSFQILHAPDDNLDLRTSSSDDRGISSGDGGDDNVGGVIENAANVDGLCDIHHDEDFNNVMRVPTLDSLPGSSRTSPILSPDPAIAAVLSPDNFLSKDAKENGVDNSSPKITLASPPFNKNNSNSKHDGDKIPIIDIATTVDTSSDNSNIASDGSTPKHQKKKSNIKSKWLDYLNSVQESNYDTDKQMEEFVKVPSAVESLLSFGFWISVDSFLYTLTILPIRFTWSLLLLLRFGFIKVAKGFRGRKQAVDNDGAAPGPFQFHRRHCYQLIQVSIIYIIYSCVLKPINISIIYHWIRVQSMVKLYLLVAIVEVFDRLMCSLGQDCLDSLYWNTTRRPNSSRLFVSALVVLTYTALHSFLLFVHVATLNVAMNSDDQALLSLLIGGNFAEIKSTVFKKYNKASLFKIVASDICERFKLALFLLLVLMLNASQGMDKKMLYSYLSMCGIVWCAEWLSDWLKHAFITKFNYIASGVYSEYGLLLAGDVSGFGHEGENLDHSHAVVKRLGLAQIPLVCVMAKYLKESYKYGTYENQPQTWMISVGVFATWLLLLLWKLSLESFLHRISRMKLEAMPEYSKNNTIVSKKNN